MQMSTGFLALPEAFSVSENLLSAYFESPALGFGVLDTGLRYVAVNYALARMNGVPPEAHLGRTLREVLGDVADSLEPHFRRTISTGTPTNFEFSALLPNRTSLGRWLVHYVPIRDAGSVTRVGAVVVETGDTKAPNNVSVNSTSKQQLRRQGARLQTEKRPSLPLSDIIGESSALQHVLAQTIRVARTDATVLILGETGTGKELIAKAIHDSSHRRNSSFVKINCAAIPAALLESEMFGHERGAFTGALCRRIGRIELAHGGTLFLDEVGDLPLELQPKLLRVLQDRQFEPLGSNKTVTVDVRLIAATNRDLTELVGNGQFRRDLFYRLCVFPIHIPPLRDRKEDIPSLIRHFVERFSRRMDRHIESISPEFVKALQEWHWPGNIRELENVIERSLILSEGKTLTVPLDELKIGSVGQTQYSDGTLEQAEREHIVRVLRQTRGVLSGFCGAAERLGLKRTTLQSKMKRLNITREDYR
jgi:formate hydrogenlyase transcriptional activator